MGIKFVIGKEFIKGKIFIVNDGAGIYSTDSEEDFEYFPVPKGLKKLKLPDDFDIEAWKSNEYDDIKAMYKYGLDSTGQRVSLENIIVDIKVQRDGESENQINTQVSKTVREKIQEMRISKHTQKLLDNGDIQIEYLDDDGSTILVEAYEVAEEAVEAVKNYRDKLKEMNEQRKAPSRGDIE